MSSPRPWQPLRLDDPYLPDLPQEGAATVALVCSPGVRAGGWGGQAAVAMARGWALTGQPTYLCDLALEEPELHTVLGVQNDEGVTDVLLYGASPRRVAHRIDEGLFLAPAGTVPPDPAAVRSSPRWDALVDGFAGADALLLLYVHADAPGIAAVLARADAVVALCARGEEPDLGEARERLVASLGPDEGEAARSTIGSAGVAEPPPVAAEAETGPATPAVPRRGCGRRLLMVLAVLALAALLVAALRWIEIPGLAAEDASGTREAPTSLSGGAIASDPLQAWSLALEAHEDGAVAAARVRELGLRWPGALFWLAPIDVRERRFHRVLAGPATTRDEVEALRARLGGDARWIAREAAWAFLLGELPELEAARTWGEVLGELGVPTHVLAVGGAEGPVRFRVYAGSYASEDEAEALRRILEEQGLDSAPFSERRGTVPA
jgi:cell division septation protein DedD